MSKYIICSIVDLCLVGAVQSHEFQEIVTTRSGNVEETDALDQNTLHVSAPTHATVRERAQRMSNSAPRLSKFRLISRNWNIMLRLAPPTYNDVTKVPELSDDFHDDKNNDFALCDFAFYVDRYASKEILDTKSELPEFNSLVAVV